MVEVVKGERLIIHGMPFEARVALVEPIDGDDLLIHLIGLATELRVCMATTTRTRGSSIARCRNG